MRRSSGVFAISLVVLALSACGDPSLTEGIERRSGALVGWGRAVTPLGGPNASETSTVVTNYSGIVHKVVAFNYDDPNHVSYTMNDRVATGGASMTGWAYSNGAGIDDPFQPAQHLTPPVGWPILWGDPGLAQASGTGYAYLTTLAVPQSKMPSGGQIHGSLENYLGGACVAPSYNAGVSFSVSAADCLHTAAYDFYDGSDVAGTAGGGPVFAAFRNVTTGSIDVWGAATSTGASSQLPNPFPGKSMASHPRPVVAGNTLFIIAAECAAAAGVGQPVTQERS